MIAKYLAIDPGKTTGFAVYDIYGKLKDLREEKYTNVWSLLNNNFSEISVCIAESYIIYGHKAHAHVGSQIETVQVIGQIKAWAEDYSIKLVWQPAHIKRTGFNYLGKKEPPKSSPLNHAYCAHAHGTYWLVNNRVIDPKDLLA